MDPAKLASLLDQSLAEVKLRFPRTVDQRNEDFLGVLLDLPDGFFDLGVSPRIALVPDPLEDPLGRVALLLRTFLVRLDPRYTSRPAFTLAGSFMIFWTSITYICRVPS